MDLIEVPIWEKATLTIEEAAAYSNIGINKINELSKKPRCPFTLYIGRKKLIKRKEFEKYISDSIEL
ncbi:MAG: excisionase [Lachnospiraceae bacterium]